MENSKATLLVEEDEAYSVTAEQNSKEPGKETGTVTIADPLRIGKMEVKNRMYAVTMV